MDAETGAYMSSDGRFVVFERLLHEGWQIKSGPRFSAIRGIEISSTASKSPCRGKNCHEHEAPYDQRRKKDT
jgi:hypothetical protein